MQVFVANPRGFCAGVDRAIEIVDRALEKFGAPVFVRHEVVHNRYVVDNLRKRGAVFVDELHEVPDNATVVFSAHGVSLAVAQEAAARHLHVFDATCPLVTKVHMEVLRYARDGCDVILIGHAGHPEVEGTMGRFDPDYGGRMHLVESVDDVAQLRVNDPQKVAFVSQTTLSVDDTRQIIAALMQKFSAIKAPQRDDICYATQNRQDAVKKLADVAELVLVVGSANSSNSNRLREIAEQCGARAYLINGALDVRKEWLQGMTRIGVTAGASAPETLVQELLGRLRDLGAEDVQELHGLSENVSFNLPQALRS